MVAAVAVAAADAAAVDAAVVAGGCLWACRTSTHSLACLLNI